MVRSEQQRASGARLAGEPSFSAGRRERQVQTPAQRAHCIGGVPVRQLVWDHSRPSRPRPCGPRSLSRWRQLAPEPLRGGLQNRQTPLDQLAPRNAGSLRADVHGRYHRTDDIPYGYGDRP